VDESAVVEATREVPIQVNGRLRDKVTVPAGVTDDELEETILSREKVQAVLAGRKPDRIIHAGGGKLVNIVVR
jgi:leucyl-tRNA synthetase